MAGLDKFRAPSAPRAFAGTARAHNLLVGLIESMQGEDGIEVSISEGRILIRRQRVAGQDSGAGGSGTSGGGVPDPLVVANLEVTEDAEIEYLFCNTIEVDGQALTLQELTICHNGSPATMYVLGSAPF